MTVAAGGETAANSVFVGALPPSRPDNILAFLTGSWSLDRTVSNGSSMIGTALFAPDGEGLLHYHERVRWQATDGRVLDGERRYLFAASDGEFRVLFAEKPPRLFHRIVLDGCGSNLVGLGTHCCGDDRYDSRFEFRADGSFVIRHDVSGPRKDYTISTGYSRFPALPGQRQPPDLTLPAPLTR